ncbi:hypothetical protein V6X42_23875 [Serratia marcescens]
MKIHAMKPSYRGLRKKLASHPYTRQEGYLLVMGVTLLFWSLVIGAICLA